MSAGARPAASRAEYLARVHRVMDDIELDPAEYGAAWNWLMGTWLPASGYQPDGRHCFEMLNDPSQHPQRKHLVEIWEPARPL